MMFIKKRRQHVVAERWKENVLVAVNVKCQQKAPKLQVKLIITHLLVGFRIVRGQVVLSCTAHASCPHLSTF